MLGAIIGDTIGSRFEFNNYLKTDFELFSNNCSYTDDTICTIAIANALLEKKPFDVELRYWCRRYSEPMGGYGGSFAMWLRQVNPQPYNSYGNGSAMRVSPCAWFANEKTVVLNLAKESAKCTHNHPEGIKGAMVVADCILLARKGAKKEYIKKAVSSYGYNLNTTCDKIRSTNVFNETCQVTVPQAIVAFLESTDFESAIRLAVSLGGDSDTIAAITGSIAEAFYGIPNYIEIKAKEFLPMEFLDVIENFKTNRDGRL